MPDNIVNTPEGAMRVTAPDDADAGTVFNFVKAATANNNMLAQGEKMRASRAPYGLREDGTPKGNGYFGPLKRPDGAVSTELSFDFDAGGKSIFAPLIVPTLSRQEIDHLLSDGTPTKDIYRKAQDHAFERIRSGKPTWALPNELSPLPK